MMIQEILILCIWYSKSSVCVKIRNRGTDAYKNNEYGDSIIVERHFSSDGVSGYKLKSKDGSYTKTLMSQ